MNSGTNMHGDFATAPMIGRTSGGCDMHGDFVCGRERISCLPKDGVELQSELVIYRRCLPTEFVFCILLCLQPAHIVSYEDSKPYFSTHVTAVVLMMEKQATPLLSKLVRPESDQDWDDRRSIIEQLYWNENQTLPQVRDIMTRNHGFLARYTPLPSSK
jgi:hypothetical protein